jgi:hypothetical protein
MFYLSVVPVEHAEELDHHLVGDTQDKGGLLHACPLTLRKKEMLKGTFSRKKKFVRLSP